MTLLNNEMDRSFSNTQGAFTDFMNGELLVVTDLFPILPEKVGRNG